MKEGVNSIRSSDPSLLSPLLPTIAKGIVMSIGVVAGMFGLTYLPQVAVLAFISGPLGEHYVPKKDSVPDVLLQPS